MCNKFYSLQYYIHLIHFYYNLLHNCYIVCYKRYANTFYLYRQPFYANFRYFSQLTKEKTPISRRFYKHFIQFYRLWRATSNIKTDAAIAAFKDSTCPFIGICTQISALFDTSSRSPLPSFPIKIAVPSV